MTAQANSCRIHGGLYAALVTPFAADESLDLGAFRAIVEYGVGCGVDGIVVAGTTGEAHALTPAERTALWRLAMAQARGRVPVVAGTGATTTREARQLLALAADAGCDAALVLTPWFEKASTEAVEAHYTELAEKSPLPIILYHIASRTHFDWPVESVARVAARLFPGKVIGIKDVTTDPQRTAALRALVPPGFLIFSGSPHRRAEFAAAGADGCIDALSSALPAECAEAYAGNARKAAYVASVNDCLDRSSNYIALLKAMMNELDLPVGKPRRPHDRIPAAEVDAAPKLRFRGGVVPSGKPAHAPATKPLHLLGAGLYEKALAANPPPGLERILIHRAVEGGYQYNHHVQVLRHAGQFWATWSAGWVNEDSPGQVVMFATSPDGRTWSAPQTVMAPPLDRLRWTAGGFFEQGGTLGMVAARCRRTRYVDGDVAPHQLWEDLTAVFFRWDGSRWTPWGDPIPNLYPNERPRRLPDGQWMIPGVNAHAEVVAAIGASPEARDWHLVTITARSAGYSAFGTKLTEPSWYICGGRIRMLLRDDAGSRRLWQVESADNGRTWSQPVPTDFSDATSKFFAMTCADGRVALVSNPAPDDLRRRFLALALSDDGGRTFTRMHKLLHDPGVTPRYPGMHKVRGFDYPAAIEHDGRLWVACTPCKEDVEILGIPLTLRDNA